MIALLLVAIAVTPSQALAMRGSGELSPRLAKLAAPSLRDASPTFRRRRSAWWPRAPAACVRDGNRVLVDVRFERGALAALDELRAAGAKTVRREPPLPGGHRCRQASQLRAIADVAGVAGVSPILVSRHRGAPAPRAGSVVSEGDGQLLAAAARGANSSRRQRGHRRHPLRLLRPGDRSCRRQRRIATHAEDDVKSGDLPGAGNECPEQTTPVSKLSND